MIYKKKKNWVSLSYLLLPLGFAASQLALADDISLGQPGYGGNGCPAGSASATLSPDNKSLSILFDAFQAEAGGNTGRPMDRKSCNISIPVHVPQGMSISVLKVDYRGFNSAPQGALNQFDVEYFFAGKTGPRYQKSFSGPLADNYTISNELQAAAVVWSDCGADLNLRTNASIVAQSNARGEQTLMTVDSADISSGIVYQLQWKSCGVGGQPLPQPTYDPAPQPTYDPAPQPTRYPPQPAPLPTRNPQPLPQPTYQPPQPAPQPTRYPPQPQPYPTRYPQPLPPPGRYPQPQPTYRPQPQPTRPQPQPTRVPAPYPPQPQPYPQPYPQPGQPQSRTLEGLWQSSQGTTRSVSIIRDAYGALQAQYLNREFGNLFQRDQYGSFASAGYEFSFILNQRGCMLLSWKSFSSGTNVQNGDELCQTGASAYPVNPNELVGYYRSANGTIRTLNIITDGYGSVVAQYMNAEFGRVNLASSHGSFRSANNDFQFNRMNNGCLLLSWENHPNEDLLCRY